MTASTIPASQIKMPLTNLQLELLKIFSFQLTNEELLEIKKLLAGYFAEKALDRMDEIWEEKKLSNETMDKWLNEESQ